MKSVITEQTLTKVKLDYTKSMRHDMSPVERKLWQHIRNNQIKGYHFRRQQIIDGYIVDFYCHKAKLSIEIDGRTHTNEEYDRYRDKVIKANGIKVFHFTNEQVVNEIEAVLEVIYNELNG